MSKKITLLGSTGSIGTQSLDVIRAQGYEVFGLSAHSHVDKILEQIEEFHPKYVCMTNPDAAVKLDAALAGRANAPKLLTGPEGLKELAAMDGPDVVLNSVVGIAGLGASLTAIESGHDLALANKESLVTGGHLVTRAVAQHGVQLLPVDSEHSAIFQCLQDKESAPSLTKILLTASGGPFFGMKTEELRTKTKADALKHPNWNMGAKITIDSATLMNKGLELIEAVWLFGLPPEKIQIVVQRQSIVHSAVQFSDNSVIAQLGVPDMRIPIQYAKRQVGRKMYGGQSTHLPLRVNTAGVIPPIFASSLLLFPATMANFDIADWLKTAASWFTPSSILYNVIFIALIFFFCFFYTAIIFDPKDVAENLKKAGGFIPGIRPGEKTQEYLDAVLSRLTLWGGVYISVISVLPMLLIAEFNVPFYFGGTSILILVGVAMDFMSQIESHLISRQYEGLMGKTRIKGRS